MQFKKESFENNDKLEIGFFETAEKSKKEFSQKPPNVSDKIFTRLLFISVVIGYYILVQKLLEYILKYESYIRQYIYNLFI